MEFHLKYDLANIEKLKAVDFESVMPRVLKYAKSQSIKLSLFGINADAEYLVNEAIARAYGQGENGAYRNWDIEKCPDPVQFFNGIVKSIVSHKIEHAMDFPEENIFYENGSSKDDKIAKSVESNILITKAKNSEEKLLIDERVKRLTDIFEQISEEDEELGLMILCFEEGLEKTRHIAEQLNCDSKHVNNLRRRLKYKLKEIYSEFSK